MATINDSSLTFFSKASSDQWAYVLSQYKEVFKVHAQESRGARKNGPAELIKLDNWYQDQLPSLIRSRKEHQLVYEDLVQLTKWKLLRGKFRPSLLDLVKTNTETAVKNVTKKAFKKMPNIASAISALTTLKGIGPATASAILVAYMPDVCPYMADENMLATPGVEATDYTSTEYLNYVEQLNTCVDRLKKLDPKRDWTPHKVELALWTHYQIKQYNCPHLENMPMSENGALAHSEDSQGQESEESSNDAQDGEMDVPVNGHKIHSEEESNGADSNGVGSNGIQSNGIESDNAESNSVSESNGADESNGVSESNGIQNFAGVSESNGISESNGVVNEVTPISSEVTNGVVSSVGIIEASINEDEKTNGVESSEAVKEVNGVSEVNSNATESEEPACVVLNGQVITGAVSADSNGIESKLASLDEKSSDSLKEQDSGNVSSSVETQKRKEIELEDAEQVAKRAKLVE